MIERLIVEHCAPTLASLKTGNLFTYNFTGSRRIQDITSMNRYELAKKDLYMIILKQDEKSALVYLFRYNSLKEDLGRKGVCEFLKSYGYKSNDIPYALCKLKERFKESDEFPHEIGLFLGYPLGDVYGFIKNKGKNCKCTGCWKVYCNRCEAEKKFKQFEKCRKVYRDLFIQGKSINRLAVSSRH